MYSSITPKAVPPLERRDHLTKNRSIHDSKGDLNAGFAADPLSEWPIELLDADLPTPNDVYGKMFYFVRDIMCRFQTRIRDPEMTFEVTLWNTPNVLEAMRCDELLGVRFDRVEVSILRNATECFDEKLAHD
jgi:hypothetical protein